MAKSVKMKQESSIFRFFKRNFVGISNHFLGNKDQYELHD